MSRSPEENSGDCPGRLDRIGAEFRRQHAVQPERREPVHQGPCRDAGGAGIDVSGGIRDGADSGVQRGGGALPSGAYDLVVRSVQLGSVHHLEVGPVANSELDVGHTELEEVLGLLLHLGERVSEQVIALGSDGRQDARLVPEMVGGRRMRYVCPASEIAEADGCGARFRDRRHGGLEHGPAQITVVVAPRSLGHGHNTTPGLVVDKIDAMRHLYSVKFLFDGVPMEPLIVLAAVTLSLLAAGAVGIRPLRRWHVCLRGGLAAMFVFTGISHFGAFGMRDELVAMVPAVLPAPEVLVTVTGLLELAGALGLLLPRLWPAAAAGLSALLVAMFPANVYKALTDPSVSVSQELAPRTAIQVVFLVATLAVLAHFRRSRRRRCPLNVISNGGARRQLPADDPTEEAPRLPAR
jgi:uncharacterized membrane protein